MQGGPSLFFFDHSWLLLLSTHLRKKQWNPLPCPLLCLVLSNNTHHSRVHLPYSSDVLLPHFLPNAPKHVCPLCHWQSLARHKQSSRHCCTPDISELSFACVHRHSHICTGLSTMYLRGSRIRLFRIPNCWRLYSIVGFVLIFTQFSLQNYPNLLEYLLKSTISPL